MLWTENDKHALAAGYTKRVYIEGGMEDGNFLVKPDADLDSRFKAWAIDWSSWTFVNGWNCLIEPAQ